MPERKITTGSGWRCLGCKQPIKDEQRVCRCGDLVSR